jgi:hypothetical protein
MTIHTPGIDIAKNVFQLHGVSPDRSGSSQAQGHARQLNPGDCLDRPLYHRD